MIGLLQRVTSASVSIDGGIFSSIGPGLLVLIGVRPDDDESSARKLLSRILQYRVFGDDTGKMSLNLRQIDGELLLVPQFTLAADTRRGLRPGFSTAAPPDLAARLFDFLLNTARGEYPKVACGSFGANMQVSLVNDGPVTFWLDT